MVQSKFVKDLSSKNTHFLYFTSLLFHVRRVELYILDDVTLNLEEECG